MPDDFHDFAIAAAGASGALIGLLFVAVSVFPERGQRTETRIEYQTRASTALVVFTNALVMSLAFLVPGTYVGGWAVGASTVLAIFTLAVTRVVVTAALRGDGNWSTLSLAAVLLAVAGFQFWAGVRLLTGDTDALPILDYVIIGEFAIGIARSWQLVNMHDTGLLSSLTTLARGLPDEEERTPS